MDWDDSYDEEWDDASGYGDKDYGSYGGRESSEGDTSRDGLDSTDITNPVSAYFFLSDDAQDEIAGDSKKRMRCFSCGHRFKGDAFDPCPKCGSYVTEERFFVDEDEKEDGQRVNMKCRRCGHRFSGDIFDVCPECFSPDIEEL